jgi:hypothetical protein
MRLSLGASFFAFAVCAAPPARAQLEQFIWQCGSLGGPLGYDLSATPGSIAALLPSFESGPTPLALIDPNDPRSLDVGLDLLVALQAKPVPPGGAVHFEYALPPSPDLAGLVFHAQAFDLPGATTLVDELSPASTFVLAFAGTAHPPVGLPMEGRRNHSATVLDSGRVLIAGGRASALPLAGAELYSPLTQTFERASPLPEPRSHHEATLLADGRVLVTGGIGATPIPYASARLFDPSTGQWQNAPPMPQGRVGHSATLLGDGRVLVVGGSSAYQPTQPVGWPESLLDPLFASSLLFDAATATWQPGPSLPFGLTAHAAVLLGDGRVLVSGGIRTIGQARQTSSTCFTFDPATDTFSVAASLPGPLAYHGAVATLDGGALITGGGVVDFGAVTLTGFAGTATYSPLADGWAIASSLPGVVVDGTTVCVPSKLPIPVPRYAVSGGFTAVDLLNGGALVNAQIAALEPAASQWSNAGSWANPSGGASISAVHGGTRLLLVGGDGLGAALPAAEVFVLE